MNFETLRKSLLMGAVGIFVWWAWKAPAQDNINVNAPARVPYAVSQVIELEQAKINDDTVIAYIRNSGNNYNLSANDILYLRQQGVSDTVLTAMLTQPRAGVAMASSYSQPAAPAPEYSEPAPQYAQPAPTPDTSSYYDTAPAAPVTYVPSAPTTYYYPSSYYYPYSYNYPSYNYYGYYGWPRPWYGWGWGWWGGGWHWGNGWHGGWNTGWHGGGWGGGGFHGGVGGGFHGTAGVSSFHGGGGGFHGSVGGGGFHGGGGGGFHGGGGHR